MTAQHSGRINSIDGLQGTTVTGGGKQVCLWDPQGQLLWKADADKYEVNHVLLHSSGCVVSTGSFGTIAVLDGETGAARHTLTDEMMPPGALFELPDGRVAVGSAEYEDLRLLDVATGALEELEPQGEQGPAMAVRVVDGVLQSLGQGLCRWDLTSHAFISRVFGPEGEDLGLVGDELAFSLSGGGAAIWRTDGGEVVHQIAGHELRSGVASRDGARIALLGEKGVTLVNVESGAVERSLEYGPWPRLVCFSDDGALVAVVVGNQGSSLKLFQVESGQDLGGWDGPRISALRLFPRLLLLGLEDGNAQRIAL